MKNHEFHLTLLGNESLFGFISSKVFDFGSSIKVGIPYGLCVVFL